ncbi:unnamed protein product [Paramecium sonneborni]|uniref:Uncharacterized protein n=1 Tax=Paramecium sonneborni TaxID=65129 RepID=A0A8S1RS60_9CILI|nr:unnamed protein product [Paramecium sonneborni]
MIIGDGTQKNNVIQIHYLQVIYLNQKEESLKIVVIDIRTLSQPKQFNQQQTSSNSLHNHRQTHSQAYQIGSFSANFYAPSTTKSRIRLKFTPTYSQQEEQQKQKNISQSPIKKKPKYTIINMSQLLSVTPKVKMHQDSLNKVLERFSNKKR